VLDSPSAAVLKYASRKGVGNTVPCVMHYPHPPAISDEALTLHALQGKTGTFPPAIGGVLACGRYGPRSAARRGTTTDDT
jgi:hypothetical protein